MARIDLKELAARESEQVEWKENVADIRDVLKTVCSFANDFQNLGGGYVVCGAKEMKDEGGFQKVTCPGLVSSRFKEIEGKVMADARSKIDPPVVPLVEELCIEDPNRRVLVFVIPASEQAHSYRSDGSDAAKYYIRASRETIEARNGVLRELLVKKQALPPWDRRLNEQATLGHIDSLAFRDFLEAIGGWDPKRALEDFFSESFRLSEFVPPLGGIRHLDGVVRPRNYALILFAKRPTEFFQGAYTVFSAYPGKDRSEPTAERHDITGSVIVQTRKVLDLLKGHQGTAFDKIDPVTPNVPRYPERALQEAVVNALVHRNYESNEPVRITVFSDRVEVRSPGALPRTVPADKFKEGRAAPSWRNQALAYFFNKLQLAQAEGQGIPTILRTMKEAGSPNPWFDLEEEAVICVLPAHARHEILRQLTGIENDLILGNYDDGHSRLLVVLESWPRHSKALAVLAQSARLRNRPEDVEKFIRKHGINPSEIEAGTVYQLAQVLLDCASNYARELAKKWFEFASQQRLKTDEVKSVTLGLRKLGKNEEAIRVINKHLEEGLIGATTASLYDIRGRARIDLAKRCTETARRHGISWALKKRAWDECRQFIELAEKDFARALELVTSPTEREFIEKDLTFVQTMRTQVRRPERRRGPRPG